MIDTSEKIKLLREMIELGQLSIMDMESKRISMKGSLFVQRDGDNLQVVILKG